MTRVEAPLTLVEQFTNALPPHGRDALRDTKTVEALIVGAINSHGWTIARLVDFCTRDTAGVANVGGVITKRLRDAVKRDMPPADGQAGLPKWVQPLPWCGRCDGGQHLDPQPRFVEDADGRPIGRCPTCYTPPPGGTR